MTKYINIPLLLLFIFIVGCNNNTSENMNYLNLEVNRDQVPNKPYFLDKNEVAYNVYKAIESKKITAYKIENGFKSKTEISIEDINQLIEGNQSSLSALGFEVVYTFDDDIESKSIENINFFIPAKDMSTGLNQPIFSVSFEEIENVPNPSLWYHPDNNAVQMSIFEALDKGLFVSHYVNVIDNKGKELAFNEESGENSGNEIYDLNPFISSDISGLEALKAKSKVEFYFKVNQVFLPKEKKNKSFKKLAKKLFSLIKDKEIKVYSSKELVEEIDVNEQFIKEELATIKPSMLGLDLFQERIYNTTVIKSIDNVSLSLYLPSQYTQQGIDEYLFSVSIEELKSIKSLEEELSLIHQNKIEQLDYVVVDDIYGNMYDIIAGEIDFSGDKSVKSRAYFFEKEKKLTSTSN